MADTTSAAPSDAEIDAQWRESVAKHEKTAAFVRDFARAVLAKWGAPQPAPYGETLPHEGGEIEGSEMREQCTDCRFFMFMDRWENTIGGFDDIGKCRRYPPTELQGDGADHPSARTHSFVVGDDWCGEFVSATPPHQR